MDTVKIYKEMWDSIREARKPDREYIILLEWQVQELVKENDRLRDLLNGKNE